MLSDLASLDTEQLLLVRSLEETGERRAVILDRVDDLLVVQEATHHLRATAGTHPAPVAAPAPPPVPTKPVSADLVDQMGGLLARDAARKSSALQTAWPLPDLGRPGSADVAPTAPGAGFWPDDGNARARRKAKKNAKVKDQGKVNGRVPPPTHPGLIVPTDDRKPGRGPTLPVLAGLLIVALLGTGGVVYWLQTHKGTSTAATSQAAGDHLAGLLMKTVPAGYTRQADSLEGGGPLDLAAAVNDDPGPGAQATLTKDGFVQGYEREWTNASGQDIIVFLYQFRTPAGAEAYGTSAVATAKSVIKPEPTTFAVTAIPGAIGLTGGDGGNYTSQIEFTKGTYLFNAIADGPASDGLAPTAQQVANAQYTLLPAK